MLEAIALSKTYDGRSALDRLDLRVEPGEVFCLLGANGAGKTTTLNLFLDFVPRSGGVARIDGLDVAQQPLETKRRLAYLPEQVMLYRHLSGLENLEYFASLSGQALARAELLSALERVGLPREASDRRVASYSKGMRQKVGLAMAVARRARALLLDEPTSGLDPQASNEFSRLVQELAQGGAAVLMATHDLFRAKEVGTRLGIMKHGRLVRCLDPADVGHADLEALYLEHMHD